MAFDEGLAHRIREGLAKHRAVSEKRMFGGVAFLLNGNMCVGVLRDEMIVRLHPEHMNLALQQAHTRAFDITGRPMKGWILVGSAGIEEDEILAKWLQVATEYAGSLPIK